MIKIFSIVVLLFFAYSFIGWLGKQFTALLMPVILFIVDFY